MYYISKTQFVHALKGNSPKFIRRENDLLVIDCFNIEVNEEVIIENEDFSANNITVLNKSERNNITFNNCTFSLMHINGNMNLKFENCQFEELQFSLGDVNFYSFHECNINLLSGNWIVAKYEDVEVENMHFVNPEYLSGFNKVKNLIFKDRSGTGYANIVLGDEFENIIFKNFHRTKAVIECYSPPKNSEFVVDNSDLTGLRFFNCNMTNSTIKFRNSNLIELKYINSKLPVKAIEIDNNEISIEAFRQLKIVSQNHFDRFNELSYKALEQNAYYHSLHPIKNFNSWFVLWFSRISNFYGTKWWFSIPLIIFSGFIFYTIFLTSLNINIFKFQDYFVNYWLFITPLHKFELLGESFNYNGWSYFIDIFYRIINYFFIYQGVQAFRMYGKS